MTSAAATKPLDLERAIQHLTRAGCEPHVRGEIVEALVAEAMQAAALEAGRAGRRRQGAWPLAAFVRSWLRSVGLTNDQIQDIERATNELAQQIADYRRQGEALVRLAQEDV